MPKCYVPKRKKLDDLSPDAKFALVVQTIRNIKRKLREGGPKVDNVVLGLYIAGHLSNDEATKVKKRIVTWKSWNVAFWEMYAAFHSE